MSHDINDQLTKGLMPKPDGYGYPGGSRDFWNITLKCESKDCVCNSGRGECAVPSKAKIGKNGRCTGFTSLNNFRKKK